MLLKQLLRKQTKLQKHKFSKFIYKSLHHIYGAGFYVYAIVILTDYLYFYSNAVYQTYKNRAKTYPRLDHLFADSNCSVVVYGFK